MNLARASGSQNFRWCYGLHCAPSQTRELGFQLLIPQHVTIFGDGALKEMVWLKYSPYLNITSVLIIRENLDTDPHKGRRWPPKAKDRDLKGSPLDFRSPEMWANQFLLHKPPWPRLGYGTTKNGIQRLKWRSPGKTEEAPIVPNVGEGGGKWSPCIAVGM